MEILKPGVMPVPIPGPWRAACPRCKCEVMLAPEEARQTVGAAWAKCPTPGCPGDVIASTIKEAE